MVFWLFCLSLYNLIRINSLHFSINQHTLIYMLLLYLKLFTISLCFCLTGGQTISCTDRGMLNSATRQQTGRLNPTIYHTGMHGGSLQTMPAAGAPKARHKRHSSLGQARFQWQYQGFIRHVDTRTSYSKVYKPHLANGLASAHK